MTKSFVCCQWGDGIKDKNK